MPHKPGKGKKNGRCNREACQDILMPGYNWFNTETQAHYCRKCANAINDACTRFREPIICHRVEG